MNAITIDYPSIYQEAGAAIAREARSQRRWFSLFCCFFSLCAININIIVGSRCSINITQSIERLLASPQQAAPPPDLVRIELTTCRGEIGDTTIDTTVGVGFRRVMCNREYSSSVSCKSFWNQRGVSFEEIYHKVYRKIRARHSSSECYYTIMGIHLGKIRVILVVGFFCTLICHILLLLPSVCNTAIPQLDHQQLLFNFKTLVEWIQVMLKVFFYHHIRTMHATRVPPSWMYEHLLIQ